MTPYRIDCYRGDDASDGISKPWRSLSKIGSLAAKDGDSILLANDSFFDIQTHVQIPANWGRVTIGKYDVFSQSTGRPVIQRRQAFKESDWVKDNAANGWYVNLGRNALWGSYVTCGGEWGLRQEHALPLDGIDREWLNVNDRLYLWAPSGTNPTKYYGSVNFAPASAGTFSFNSTGTDIVIQDIDSKDGGGLVLAYSNSGLRNILVRRCAHRHTGIGIYLLPDQHSTPTALSVEVTDCDFAEGITAYVTAYGRQGFGGLKVNHCRFSGGNAGYPQGNIYLQASGAASHIVGNVFEDIHFGTIFHPLDGCAVYAEIGSDQVYASCNHVKNSYMAFQDNSGAGTHWYANVIENCKQAMHLDDLEGAGHTQHEFWNNTIIGAGAPIETDAGPDSGGIGWYCYADLPVDLRGNNFKAYAPCDHAAIQTGVHSTGVIQGNVQAGFKTLAQDYRGGVCPVPIT